MLMRCGAVMVLAMVLLGCGGSNGGGATADEQIAYHAVATGNGFPTDPFTLAEAVEAGDQRAIRDHAWQIWAAMTAPSGEHFHGQDLPIWETWYSSAEIYSEDPIACTMSPTRAMQRPFESPAQHFHGQEQAADQVVTSMNRFTAEVAHHVCNERYYLASTLDALNDGFTDITPIAARTIDEFPPAAIATKPVFWVVPPDRITMMPYWAGASSDASTNPAQPGPSTWKQCVAVVPPGVVAPPSPYVGQCNDVADYPAPVVRLDDFYHFKLTAAEVAAMENADLHGVTAVAGDFAALVAMHVTTKELPNWTWQTFWWTPTPDDSLHGADRIDAVHGEWRHYDMCTAYSMVDPPEDPSGAPVICFNPYLETDLTDVEGTESNCMTCHRLAAWPNFSTPYVASGLIEASDEMYFSDNTKLDFLWSVTRAVK